MKWILFNLTTSTFNFVVLFPSSLLIVIVAFPAFFPVITPSLDTVATFLLLLEYVKFLFVALLGFIVVFISL